MQCKAGERREKRVVAAVVDEPGSSSGRPLEHLVRRTIVPQVHALIDCTENPLVRAKQTTVLFQVQANPGARIPVRSMKIGEQSLGGQRKRRRRNQRVERSLIVAAGKAQVVQKAKPDYRPLILQ